MLWQRCRSPWNTTEEHACLVSPLHALSARKSGGQATLSAVAEFSPTVAPPAVEALDYLTCTGPAGPTKVHINLIMHALVGYLLRHSHMVGHLLIPATILALHSRACASPNTPQWT